MTTLEVSRSKTGARCLWEAGGFNGKNYGYSQIVTDYKGRAKTPMFINPKENICGEHVLFGLRLGDFVIRDEFYEGRHTIKVLYLVEFIDAFDVSFAAFKQVWAYGNGLWGVPGEEIREVYPALSLGIIAAMRKAEEEGCYEGRYLREKN